MGFGKHQSVVRLVCRVRCQAVCRIGGWAVCLWLLAAPPVQAALVMLDPGHNPDQGGATSCQGVPEVAFNDRFARELARALRDAGWEVAMTRSPETRIGTRARADLANALDAALLLSIHHDSTQLRYLVESVTDGRVGYCTIKPIEGYSVYVSRENPAFVQSYRLATLLAGRLHQLGRPPALHHAEAIPGENLPLLDPRLGIYAYDALAVLRHARMPAVLLEVGVITDRRDEAYVDEPNNRRRMIAEIVQALSLYRETQHVKGGDDRD